MRYGFRINYFASARVGIRLMPLLIVCGTFEVISGPCPIRENLTPS